MSANSATDEALRFHAVTKYRVLPGFDADDERRYAIGTPPDLEPPIWEEDWSIEPRPYKVYPTLEPLALATELRRTTLPALEAIARSGLSTAGDAALPDRTAIAQLARL